jgi:hypothetical protein
MKFRAVLVDPDANHERTQQIFGNDIAQLREWATLRLATAVTPGAAVRIYQTAESVVELILKPKPEEKPA